MSFRIAFSFALFLTYFHCIVISDLSNRIVFTTSREGDPETWFDNENPQFEYIGQLDVGETRYIKARIRQTDTKKKISSFREDPDVEILRQKPEISWIKQEKFKARKTKTSDPEWPNLWYMNDEVSPSMKVTEAWNIGYSGKGVVIAVVDDGLQTDHPDIAANIDITNSVQIKDGKITNDPNPKFPSDKHGTWVTGLIAAVKDNNICIPGVAYNSTIIGVQLLSVNDTDDSKNTFDSGGLRTSSGDDTNDAGSIENIVDSDEASALQHNKSIVEIYSNSWGPIDGTGFEGPEAITENVLRNGVTNGRNGKGAIYVISAGNGGTDDNCNADGYANSKYTIAITSVQTGRNANYAEVCAAALAATYGGSHQDRYLTTTDTDVGCISDDIAGTSFSAPIASGIIAMALEANSNLTWRDIQHLIVLTSNRYLFTDTFSGWSTNGADQEFSQILGFGLMDAEAMVSLGSKWTSVSQQLTCKSITNFVNVSTTTSTLNNSVDISTEECLNIAYLEHVEAEITFSYTGYRGVIQLYLISPAGTKSNLLHYRPEDAEDNKDAGNHTWTYMSVHFWGETASGSWVLQISSNHSSVTVTLDEWFLRLYGHDGTTIDPWKVAIYRVVFSIETPAYQTSDSATMNNQSSIEYKDIKAGLERYWSNELGQGFYCLSLNRLTPTQNGSILVDQKVYTRNDSVNSFVKTCYDLVNGNSSLRFGRITSLKASTANISKYKLHKNTVEISNVTEINELCSIRTSLVPCYSSQECEISNDKPSCIFKQNQQQSASVSENIGAIIGGVFGGMCVLVGGFFAAIFIRRQKNSEPSENKKEKKADREVKLDHLTSA